MSAEAAVLLLKAWQAYDLIQDIATELDTDIDDLLQDIERVKEGNLAIDEFIQMGVDARDSSTSSL